VPVVDLLEVVDVEHEQAHRTAVAVVGRGRSAQGVVEGGAVVQPRERVDARLLPQQVDELLAAQGHPHARLELHRMEGLGDVVHGAALERVGHVLDAALHGDEEHGHVARGGVLLQHATHLEPVHVRHVDVQEDHGGPLGDRGADALGGRGGGEHPAAEVGHERRLHLGVDPLVVVDQQRDRSGGHGFPRGPEEYSGPGVRLDGRDT